MNFITPLLLICVHTILEQYTVHSAETLPTKRLSAIEVLYLKENEMIAGPKQISQLNCVGLHRLCQLYAASFVSYDGDSI